MRVSVVMLMSPGRESMQCRALRSIKEQIYQNIEVVAFDTSHLRGKTIGYMRNVANAAATGDLIAHADDDDVSHPRRLEEQVALLMASGKACVGYNELLFWDTRAAGEAWIYRNYDPTFVCGASMLYRREAWEACPFDEAAAEDKNWWLKNAAQCVGVSGIPGKGRDEPRMIARIHGGNTSKGYERAKMAQPEWRRAGEFDAYCERTMQL